MEDVQHIEDVQARANIFRLLGRLLYQPATESFLQQFQAQDWQDWEEAGCHFDDDIHQPLHALHEALCVEFTSLWLAPGGVPVYESVFKTGMVFQHPADEMAEIYATNGFSFDDQGGKRFSDHLGIEMEFYGELMHRQGQAMAAGDVNETERLKAIIKTLLVKHLGIWGPAALHHSVRAAEHSFYREICGLAMALLDDEISARLPRKEAEQMKALFNKEPKAMDYDADFRKASGL